MAPQIRRSRTRLFLPFFVLVSFSARILLRPSEMMAADGRGTISGCLEHHYRRVILRMGRQTYSQGPRLDREVRPALGGWLSPLGIAPGCWRCGECPWRGSMAHRQPPTTRTSQNEGCASSVPVRLHRTQSTGDGSVPALVPSMWRSRPPPVSQTHRSISAWILCPPSPCMCLCTARFVSADPKGKEGSGRPASVLRPRRCPGGCPDRCPDSRPDLNLH